MVQIKRNMKITRVTETINFISHMVQIKPLLGEKLQFEYPPLYPTWFR